MKTLLRLSVLLALLASCTPTPTNQAARAFRDGQKAHARGEISGPELGRLARAYDSALWHGAMNAPTGHSPTLLFNELYTASRVAMIRSY